MPVTPLLAALTPVIDYTGSAVRAAGWYGATTGLHTVAIKTLNFCGTLSIEGSLAVVPGDGDWFPILLDGQPALSFPRISALPTYGPSHMGESVTLGFTFVCNCVWLRAKMRRTNLIPEHATEAQIAQFGTIDSVLLMY